jgi:serine/threonine protein kinase
MLLGAAAMDPLAMFMLRAQRHYDAGELVLLLASPICAAFVAHQISRVVHRLNARVVKAREVGSYRLVERLGEGGMAEVWRANHRMLARPAAVKLIRPKVLVRQGPREAERLLRLFTREVQATASLSSPHTIQVYDFGVTREGAFYYVMELLDGIDLQRLVERHGPQPAERVAYLLIQACRSLREAHERDFVHRDVKPANIFACSLGGEFDFVKVLDFGLVLDRHPTPEELEDEKRFLGTPAVMAPEMIRFQSPVDARADIYALGCVAYWLLAGTRVFEATTLNDMLVMHAHQKPMPPSRRLGVRDPGVLDFRVSLDRGARRAVVEAAAGGATLDGLRRDRCRSAGATRAGCCRAGCRRAASSGKPRPLASYSPAPSGNEHFDYRPVVRWRGRR